MTKRQARRKPAPPRRGGSWRENGSDAGSSYERIAQISFVGLLIAGLVGVLIWWFWPPNENQTQLFILAVESNSDVAPIPFQDQDLEALQQSFTSTTVDTYNDVASFESKLEQYVQAAQTLSDKDTVLLYISAHGYCLEYQGQRKPVLLTTDFDSSSAATVDVNGAVSVKKLVDKVAEIKGKNKVILLDTGHLYTNPADGLFVNDFAHALHRELKEWKSTDTAPDNQTDSDSSDEIWLVTSGSLLEVPLHSDQRTLFSEAVESVFSGNYEPFVAEDYIQGISIEDYYSRIYSYTKSKGGKSAPTPLLFHAGTGLITSPDSTSAVRSSVVFFPNSKSQGTDTTNRVEEGSTDQAVEAEQAVMTGEVKLRAVGNFEPDSRFISAPNQESNSNAASPSPDGQAATPRMDPVEKWIAEQIEPQLQRQIQSNGLDEEKQQAWAKRILDAYAEFYAARSRLHQYFQIFETISWFQLEELDALHQQLVQFSAALEKADAGFELTTYLLKQSTADNFEMQIAELTESENRVRISINEVFINSDAMTGFERSTLTALLNRCELFSSGENSTQASLKKIDFRFGGDGESKLEESVDPIQLAWASLDPWKFSSRNWKKLEQRITLAARVCGTYSLNHAKQDSINARLRGISDWNAPEVDSGLEQDLNEAAQVGRELVAVMNDRFGSDQQHRFFAAADAAPQTAAKVSETFFPELSSPSALNQLVLKKPPVKEVVQIEQIAQELRVEKRDTALVLRIKAVGEQVDNVKIECRFAETDSPFEIVSGNGIRRLAGREELDHEIKLRSKLHAGETKFTGPQRLFVRVTGTKESDEKSVSLKLPLPNLVDFVITPVGENSKGQTAIGLKGEDASRDKIRLRTFSNKTHSYQFGLVNRYHDAKSVQVQLFPTTGAASPILPGRIDDGVMARTRDAIRRGVLLEFAAAKIKLDPASSLKVDVSQAMPIKLLSPDDPTLAGDKPDGGDKPEGNGVQEPGTQKPSATDLSNGALCRVTDGENPERYWDFWIEAYPIFPDYVEIDQSLEDGELFLDLALPEDRETPDMMALTWRLENSTTREKIPLVSDSFLLSRGARHRVSLGKFARGSLTQSRLLFNIDDWPRALTFDFDGVAFQPNYNRREVRIVDVTTSPPGMGPGNSDPEAAESPKFVDLPNEDNQHFGLRPAGPRPPFVYTSLEVDVSVKEYFDIGLNSQILLSPGESPGSFRRLAFPRSVSTVASVSKGGQLQLKSTVADFKHLKTHVGGDSMVIEPRLRLESRDGSRTEERQAKRRITFDKQPPKIVEFELVREVLDQGDQPEVIVHITDRGTNFDPESGIRFFASPSRIKAFEGLPPVVPSSWKKSQNGSILFTLPPVKEQGERYLGLVVQDRVGNSAQAVRPPNALDDVMMKVRKKTVVTKPPPESTFTLRLSVLVGSQPLGSIHKNPKVSIKPEDAVGATKENVYTFENLTIGQVYVVEGEAVLPLGDKVTGKTTIKVTKDAGGRPVTRTLTLK